MSAALLLAWPGLLAAQTAWSGDGGPALEPPAMVVQAQGQDAIAAQAGANAAQGVVVTVRGTVLNANTGHPLPRALVTLETGDAVGALSDGDGRFEISGVPAGLQTFNVLKPGFRGSMQAGEYAAPVSHTVRVAASMPELALSMMPENALHGRISLSTGDPAVGIGVTLLKLILQDGRATWTEAETHQTTPEGDFRFSGLEDGNYLVVTQAALDNDRAAAPVCNGTGPAKVDGYPITLPGEASDVAAAARIHLAGGETGQVSLILTLSSFYMVQAKVPTPAGGGKWQFNSTILDRNGQKLDYPTRMDEKDHALCAYLPNGLYTLTVEGANGNGGMAEGDLAGGDFPGPPPPPSRRGSRSRSVAGLLDFSVDNGPEKNLRMALSAGLATPVHVRYEPTAPAPRTAASRQEGFDEEGGDVDPLGLWAVRANGAASRAESQENADRTGNDAYELGMVAPGSYWIHASANRKGTCLGAVTAGGMNLAHTPWAVGAGGTGTPIDVVIRTDCAKLTLQLPAAMREELPGEERSFYVDVVPDFESIADVRSNLIRPSAGTSLNLEDLTPGAYSVLVFDSPQTLEYQNPAAMERLAGKGQHVMLPPGGSASLVLEAPAR